MGRSRLEQYVYPIAIGHALPANLLNLTISGSFQRDDCKVPSVVHPIVKLEPSLAEGVLVYNLSLGGKDENRLSQIVTTELQTIWAGGVGLRGGT